MTSELYFQRTEERDLRKAKLKEKKEQSQNEALLQAIKVSSQSIGLTECETPRLCEACWDLSWGALPSQLSYPARPLESEHHVQLALSLLCWSQQHAECAL